MWGKLTDKTGTFGGATSAPAIDGICGHVTIGAIETFLRWYWVQHQQGGFTDGRVDPLPLGTHTMPLDDINKGFDLMTKGESIRSVVIY